MGVIVKNVNKTVYFIPQQRLFFKPLFVLRILNAFLFVNTFRQEGEIVVGRSSIKPPAGWIHFFSWIIHLLYYWPSAEGNGCLWIPDPASLVGNDRGREWVPENAESQELAGG